MAWYTGDNSVASRGMTGSAWGPKLRRARHHELDLEAALRKYSQLDPFELVSKLEGNDLVVRDHMRHEIPKDLSLILRHFLHNTLSPPDRSTMVHDCGTARAGERRGHR